jgi:hypothetical protein
MRRVERHVALPRVKPGSDPHGELPIWNWATNSMRCGTKWATFATTAANRPHAVLPAAAGARIGRKARFFREIPVVRRRMIGPTCYNKGDTEGYINESRGRRYGQDFEMIRKNNKHLKTFNFAR